MFRAEKCCLCFDVEYNGRNVIIQRTSSNGHMATQYAPVIRENLVLLAELAIRNVPPLSRHGALMDYFIERGWTITRLVPSLVEQENGHMVVTFV